MKFRTYISLILLAAISAAGCTNLITDAEPPFAAGISSYSWRTDSLISLGYTIEDATGKSAVTLNFAPTADRTIYNAFEVRNGNTISDLKIVNNSDSLSIAGLTPYSIIPIPFGYSLTRIDTAVSHSFPHMLGIFGAGMNNNFIAYDDSGNVYYSVNNAWKRSDYFNGSASNRELIVGICKHLDTVYYATTNAIYYSTSMGADWRALQLNTSLKNITAIAGDKYGVYVATSTNFYVLNGSAKPLTIPIGQYLIKSMSPYTVILKDSTYRGVIIAGENILFFVNTVKQQSLYFGEVRDKITTVLGDSLGHLIVATDEAIYRAKDFDSLEVIGNETSGFISVASFKDGYRALTGSGGVVGFSFNAVTVEPLPTISQPRALASINGALAMTTIDSGIYITHATDWSPFSVGLGKEDKSFKKIDLPLQLLARTDSSLYTGRSWNAGKILFKGTVLNITATVGDYADSVKVTDGVTFASVYAIKYTLSNSLGATPLDYPQWVIYFARNEGPILIDELENGKPKVRVYRSTR